MGRVGAGLPVHTWAAFSQHIPGCTAESHRDGEPSEERPGGLRSGCPLSHLSGSVWAPFSPLTPLPPPFNCGHPGRMEWDHLWFQFPSLMVHVVKHLLLCLSAMYIPSLEKCLFLLFAHFQLGYLSIYC